MCNSRTEALDVDQCAYDNCYDKVYGVVQVPFRTEMYEGDTGVLGEKLHFLYVNTPLCKAHYKQVPSMGYIWEASEEEWNTNE